MPELVVGDVALGFLINLAPPFGGSGDKLPCDLGIPKVSNFDVLIHNDANKYRNHGHAEMKLKVIK